MKNLSTLKIGSRGSALALAQVEEIRQLLKRRGYGPDLDVLIYDTQGDRDRKTPLTAALPDDFFTNTLDQALLNKEIDVAVHSAKDLPKRIPDGLAVVALTEGMDDTDALVGKRKLKDLPPGSRVGTSSPLRQESLKALYPKLKPRDIRGDITSRLRQLDEGKFDAVIVATCALKRLGLAGRIKEILPWEPAALQGQLAVVARSADKKMARLFSSIDARPRYGAVYLVGAGPGAADLITLRGIRVLRSADIVFYDYLINKELLRHAPDARKMYVGKRKGAHTLPQRELNKRIRDAARQGLSVVRLKGGDPLVFGRGAEEIDYLRAYHIDVRIVPGVSSATGIPASLSIPMTARGISDSVAFVSGHGAGESPGGTRHARPVRIPDCDTIVFLMGLTKLEEIVGGLRTEGWAAKTPIVIISKGTYPDERIVEGSLDDILKRAAKAKLQPPALIVAGETVRFFRPPHKERTILYTGTDPDRYKTRGHLVHHPMIAISPRVLPVNERGRLIKRFKACDVVMFTSRFSVIAFFDLLKKERIGRSLIGSKRFVSIGRATAQELAHRGINADCIAYEESARGLLRAMKHKYALRGLDILFPRSALPNPFLKQALRKEGARVHEFSVYENTKPAARPLPETAVDEVYFTSPSTVNNFLRDHKSIPRAWKIKSRGELTAARLRRAGYKSELI